MRIKYSEGFRIPGTSYSAIR